MRRAQNIFIFNYRMNFRMMTFRQRQKASMRDYARLYYSHRFIYISAKSGTCIHT